MPQQPKWKIPQFIESDVEGDWVHCIKQPWLDKGKGQMEMTFSDLEDGQNNSLAQYWVDIHCLMDLNEAVAHSLKTLIA